MNKKNRELCKITIDNRIVLMYLDCARNGARTIEVGLMTVAQYADELLTEHKGNHVAAFMDAIGARGTDARTKQFKHYDKIIKWMSNNWSKELDYNPLAEFNS